MNATHLDVIVFGATSFVGRLVAAYMLEQYGVNGPVQWAVAARSATKLRALRDDLGEGAQHLELLVADAADEAALRSLCSRTRVIVTTVGPYALYGEPLVRVCAESGTDYCDLTAEFQWMHSMLERYGEQATASGARIVHCCGFDSIPSDLGVLFLQQHARSALGVPCSEIHMRVKALRGGFSGGTLASIINLCRELSADPSRRSQLASPYALCPDEHRMTERQHAVRRAEWDANFTSWLAPFVMAPINTRIVFRSNALSDYAYGENFRYDEALLTGAGFKGRLTATALASALAVFMAAAAFRPSRWLLEKMLPGPGSGPDAEARNRGYFDLRFAGTAPTGQRLAAKVTGDSDPGYGTTAKMLAEAGVCLAQDLPRNFAGADKAGGFWTPATLFGPRLIERLQASAGMTFERLD